MNPVFRNSQLDGPYTELVGYRDNDPLTVAYLGQSAAPTAKDLPKDVLYDNVSLERALQRRDLPTFDLIAWQEVAQEVRADAEAAKGPGDQALVLRLRRPRMSASARDDWDREIMQLERDLDSAFRHSAAGEVDGHDRDGTLTVLYCYGRSADIMWELAQPLLTAIPLAKGSVATVRRGEASDLDAEEVEFALTVE